MFTLTWVEKAWIFFHTYFVTDSQLEIDSVTHEVGQLGEVGRHINFHLIINKNEKKKSHKTGEWVLQKVEDLKERKVQNKVSPSLSIQNIKCN